MKKAIGWFILGALVAGGLTVLWFAMAANGGPTSAWIALGVAIGIPGLLMLGCGLAFGSPE
jgi:hypothetical protein